MYITKVHSNVKINGIKVHFYICLLNIMLFISLFNETWNKIRVIVVYTGTFVCKTNITMQNMCLLISHNKLFVCVFCILYNLV